MLIIKMLNSSGGELDTASAHTNQEAAYQAARMITAAGELSAGDRIVIEGEEDDGD